MGNNNINKINKKTITLGIPAFNEEANIKRLLTALLGQEETNFRIRNIIIVIDDSRDKTEEIVKSFTDKRIQILKNKKRQGQIYSQNRIFSHTDSDITVLLEADTYPQGKKYLHELLQPMISDSEIGLVHGNVETLPSTTIIGRILELQVKSSHRFTVNAPDIDAWFSTGRGGRAFSKSVYTKLVWPPAVPDDVFALLWCRENSFKTVFRRSAVCFYKTPQHFSDLLKERQKIRSGEKALKHYYTDEFFNNIYHKPKSYMVKPVLYFLLRYPLAFFGYFILRIRLYKNLTNKRFTDYWPTANSTKLL